MNILTSRASWLSKNTQLRPLPTKILWNLSYCSLDRSIFVYYSLSTKRLSTISQAFSLASSFLSKRIARNKNHDIIDIDPLRMVAKEMECLTGNIRQLLGSGHPSLDTVAKYYTQSEGKHIRPLIVLLMSKATALAPKASGFKENTNLIDINHPISPLTILSDVNPSASSTTPTSNNPKSHKFSDYDILPSQRRLAEITELIHTASLLHDDVIDFSTARRGNSSANLEFGNKMAVLAGDFLLARASVALARLRDAEVTELLATVIANLVEGEFMQLKNTSRDEKSPIWTEDTITYYLKKTYLKTASLISKSCRASALISGADSKTVDSAYSYGKNLGLAFQLIDDMLDYTTSETELGKPAGADLKLGLATAPLLFAWQHNEELGLLVGRKFANDGDVSRARHLVLKSDGLDRTFALAEKYAEQAIESLSYFPRSEAKEGLEQLAIEAIKRRK